MVRSKLEKEPPLRKQHRGRGDKAVAGETLCGPSLTPPRLAMENGLATIGMGRARSMFTDRE